MTNVPFTALIKSRGYNKDRLARACGISPSMISQRILMRGILIDPGCEPKVCKLPDTAQGLNGFLGGEVQVRRFGQVFAALVYTHQATQAMPNRHYIDRWYYGRLLIVGWRSNRMTDLPHALAEELCRKWSSVEAQV